MSNSPHLMFLSASPQASQIASSDEKKRRRKFTPEEDELLKELVEKLGVKKWDQIAQHVPGRTGRQCRDRYRNYLVPGFFNGQWTQEEDDLIREKVLELGPHWSVMTKYFKNRSANALKNRWNYFVCRQAPSSVAHETVSSPEVTADCNHLDLSDMNFESMVELSDFRVDGDAHGIFAQDAFFF